MKKYLIYLLLAIFSLQASAQSIDFDVFGNLQYESKDRRYKAYLRKDVFDKLIFTDNNNNEITFNKKYLDLYYPNILKEDRKRMFFFRNLINTYRVDCKYVATYSVDIFDKVVIEDNRNNSVVMATDIFDNPTYEEKKIM